MPAARRTVMALFADIRTSTGISGHLARRMDDPLTWMEIYEPLPDALAFRQMLEARAQRYLMDQMLMAGSKRKTEIFVQDVMDGVPENADTQCA